jgi:hypothetical protein
LAVTVGKIWNVSMVGPGADPDVRLGAGEPVTSEVAVTGGEIGVAVSANVAFAAGDVGAVVGAPAVRVAAAAS